MEGHTVFWCKIPRSFALPIEEPEFDFFTVVIDYPRPIEHRQESEHGLPGDQSCDPPNPQPVLRRELLVPRTNFDQFGARATTRRPLKRRQAGVGCSSLNGIQSRV